MTSTARLEGKLVDIVAKSWENAMPAPNQIALAITEGVRLAMLEHLTGKPAPYLVDTNLPKFMQDMMESGELVPKAQPPANGALPTPPAPPQNSPTVAAAPPPARPAPQPGTAVPTPRAYTVTAVSVSDNDQRYLNVKLENGPRLRFYLNSTTQHIEWMSLLHQFLTGCGVTINERGKWETDHLLGKQIRLYGSSSSTRAGLASVAEALGVTL